MTHQQLVDRHYTEIDTADFSDAEELFSLDVVTWLPDAGPFTGIEPFVEYGRAFLRAFPDGRIHRDHYLESGDRVVVEGRFTGTNTGPLRTPAGELAPTGRAMTLPFADVFRVVEGKIAEHRVYYDSLDLLTQLGLAPAPASP
ncbi:ester cyclase [Geodermatophilus sp. YIM 151500]|uniref:ester cyclase n=1 Tax=Geodermatophilus sp. YIM 151500 TaxID=2984531 RepID=UPI0021E4D894|nr:ester cyclase [Geodermatophilus sp. YIM 151500]MCV2489219.1 ester cyclase [Geodermatophilus sp. YIM 151500]